MPAAALTYEEKDNMHYTRVDFICDVCSRNPVNSSDLTRPESAH